ncbi:MAG: SHOCT domain-containing protein [Deltaproteobacteria bacterium]|nr:SHOCT domain-containing protein [Deltaproteobacteria bacterium]
MMGGSMGLLMIMFWIVLIFGFIMLVSSLINGLDLSKKNDEEPERPLEILKQRYARGEIDKVEYQEKREHLTH